MWIVLEKQVEMNAKNKQETVEEEMDGKVGMTAVDGVVQERPMPWAKVVRKEAAGIVEEHITPTSVPRAREKEEVKETEKEKVVENQTAKEANKVKAEAKDPKADAGTVEAHTMHQTARKGKRRAKVCRPTR